MPPIVYAPLAQTGLLRFSGADAQTFLQGQLSCDVAALQPLRATHGSYNTPKGRMLASFVLWRAGADYFMQLPHALCEPIRKRLSMYILRSKVQAADVSDKYALIGLLDAKAPGAIDLPATPMTLSETAGGWALRLDARRVEIIVPATQAAEIGELLETSPNTVAGRYRYGLQKIKSRLEGIIYEKDEPSDASVACLAAAPAGLGA